MAKKQPFKKQRHKVGKYLFVFSEADDQAYLYAFKENIPCFFILFADIFDEQKHLTAHYERVWEKKTNTAHVENFIKNSCKMQSIENNSVQQGKRSQNAWLKPFPI